MLNRNDETYSQELIVLGNNQSIGGTIESGQKLNPTIDQMINGK